jgi:hypothetical protein
MLLAMYWRNTFLPTLLGIAMSLVPIGTGCKSSTTTPAEAPAAAVPATPAETAGAASASAPATPAATAAGTPAPAGPSISEETAARARATLRAKHGEAEAVRIDRGVAQVRSLWRAEDGDDAAFLAFVEAEFLPTGPALDATFARLEFVSERIGGYFTSMVRDLRRGVDLDLGPLLDLDQRLAAFSPGAHLTEDLFATKIAFVVLLNFPRTTLEERLAKGMTWSRRQWAETRLADGFQARVPAEVEQRMTAAAAAGDSYISAYNVYMHHVLDPNGQRLFPAGMRLISHWNLRDELKAHYATADGVPKQRIIQRVMERIVRQEIPAAVVNNPLLDWRPDTNEVTVSPVSDVDAAAVPPTATREASNAREPDTRYRHWLSIFHAARMADPYYPDAPSLIARRFDINREIPEPEVEALFESVLAAPEGAQVAALIAKRLGRPLEPFDVWYVGFKPRGKYTEADLDARTRKKYPTAAAYAADIPRLLQKLGFSKERARFLAEHIEVEPSRGAGHAFGAARRDDKAHLRTRVNAGGMDYKGYNIAVHEMGHNVEQVFSVTTIDHTLLQGVPNNAFTEALAFVFQSRDLELLGLAGRDPEAAHLKALEEFWATREIAGVGLIDMRAWRWLYAHPEATPAEFREAVVGIAQEVWNRYYAELLGARDVPILAVYSHMVDSAMYTPDYPLGHLIAFQVEKHFEKQKGKFGTEFERITQLGRLTPDAWMRNAVGGPLSAAPLLEATRAALAVVR